MENAQLAQSVAQHPLLVFQHAQWEGPGLIGDLAQERGIDVRIVEIWNGAPIPDAAVIEQAAGLVIMGGPMGALDDELHPHLGQERAAIRIALDLDLPVLGICLGHQLLAVVLGATLLPNSTEEIGLADIELSSRWAPIPTHDLARSSVAPALHWHRDCVSEPPGSTVLATSQSGSIVQAFSCASALGLQFHLELTTDQLDEWLAVPTMLNDLPPGLTPEALRTDFANSSSAIHSMAVAVFGEFLDRLGDRRMS